MKKDVNEASVESVVMRVPSEGDKLKVITPIDIAEDLRWEIGQVVEIVQVVDGGFEIEDSSGVVASFATQDLQGEYRWFDYA